MNQIVPKLKKIFLFIFSRSFYFVLGIVLAISIYVAQAAWNTTVTDGTPLTPVLWNDLVAKVSELVAKVAEIDSSGIKTVNVLGFPQGFCVFKRTGYSCPSWAPTQEGGPKQIGIFINLDDSVTGSTGHGYNITICCAP